MTAYKDKFQLLVASDELIYYAGSEIKTTKGVAKTMLIFGMIYDSLFDLHQKTDDKDLHDFMKKHDKNKFLQGSLFSLNGLLNVEAKSYLLTKDDLP